MLFKVFQALQVTGITDKKRGAKMAMFQTVLGAVDLVLLGAGVVLVIKILNEVR